MVRPLEVSTWVTASLRRERRSVPLAMAAEILAAMAFAVVVGCAASNNTMSSPR